MMSRSAVTLHMGVRLYAMLFRRSYHQPVFAALFKKTAIEFRKSIINYNALTRGYVHPEYSVKKNENFDREIENGDFLKLSILDFCDFWIATSVLETCMHGSNFFTLPGPVRSEVKVCSCACVIGLDQWFPTCGPRAKRGRPGFREWPFRPQKVALDLLKNFKNICATTAKFTF